VSPEFSRSGRSIAYGDVSERLWQARSDGTRPRRLGPAGITGRDPRWSPDDERVAFLDVSSGPRLRLLRVRSNRVTTLRADEATADRAFAWSPDGHWLAVARSAVYQCDPLHQCEDFELWIVNADDRRARRIYRAPGGIVYGLDWRPPAP
jgi:Tol biopolymer transport system component